MAMGEGARKHGAGLASHGLACSRSRAAAAGDAGALANLRQELNGLGFPDEEIEMEREMLGSA